MGKSLLVKALFTLGGIIMFSLVSQYFMIFIIAVPALFITALVTRIKFAKTKKDKTLFTLYSVISGMFTVGLLLYKFL